MLKSLALIISMLVLFASCNLDETGHHKKPIERLEQSHESAPEFKGGEIEFNYLTSMLFDVLFKHYYDLFPEQTHNHQQDSETSSE
jgi:hypothetical protein